jgi:putative endopeptidase
LEALAGNFPWSELPTLGGVQAQQEFVVAELDAVQALGKWFTTEPVATWRSYLKYHYLVNHAAVLPKAFDDEVVDFYARTLNGQPKPRDRWKRAINSLEGSVGEVVGQVYVKQHFPPESKQQMLELVNNLHVAYAQRIRNLPWMSWVTPRSGVRWSAMRRCAIK